MEERRIDSMDRKMIILQDLRGFYKILNINREHRIKWKKKKVNISILKTAQLPGYFIVRQDKLEKYDHGKIEEIREKVIGDGDDLNVLENNMDIIQTEEGVQQLNMEKINNLKKRDEGESLVDEIASNNLNFNKRTKFSQQKYKEKKKMKYMIVFRVDNLNIRNLNSNANYQIISVKLPKPPKNCSLINTIYSLITPWAFSEISFLSIQI